jgi:transcription initiation factor TFIIH subunit 2
MLMTRKEKLDAFNKQVQRKSLIRYLTVIIDFSRAALRQDLRPSRAVVTKRMACKLLNEFEDQNPLGKVSVVVTMK